MRSFSSAAIALAFMLGFSAFALAGNDDVGATPSRSAVDYPSAWECDTQKFTWYCDKQPEKVEKSVEAAPAAPVAPKAETKPKEVVEMEKMQAKLEELKKIAVMNPTNQNVKEYIAYQAVVMDKASVFADVWRRVVWAAPELDYSLQHRPTNNLAMQTYDTKRSGAARSNLSSLAKTHGLFFFFRSDCPYCHALAPTLKRFESMYGLKIFPVSLDGKGLAEYPRPTPDNGIATQLNVTTVPALFLAVPGAKQITPIGYGVMSMTEIEERIYLLTQTQPGQNF